MKRACFGAVLLLVLLDGVWANHFDSYVYSYWKEPVPIPAAYLPAEVFTAPQVGLAPLKAPADIHVSGENEIFITDTRNDRIVRLSSDWKLISVIDGFRNPTGQWESFNEPGGVCVSPAGELYVADTQNQRIVVLTVDGEHRRTLGVPESDVIREEYKYLPSKVLVDEADRIYVVGPGMYEGIMELNQEGGFAGFLGSNRVQFDIIDYFWKQVATEEQRAGMVLFIPEEFSNLDIDDQGFIYSTTLNEEAEQPVKKHNAQGLDVLKREGYFIPAGDVAYNNVGSIIGPSTFIDVAVDENGIYHTLDSKRGRVFTYDRDGNLLSAFGGPGHQLGLFRKAVSMDIMHGKLLVLDQGLGRVTVFEPTEYGRTLREAIIRYGSGDYEMAAALWQKVLSMNANMELAYVGLGKIQLRRDSNRAAMTNFRLGNNREYYSKAFKDYRKQVLRQVFPFLLTALVFLFFVNRICRHYRPKDIQEDRMRFIRDALPFHMRLRFGGYILKHPFDGFWDLKYQRIGTPRAAAVVTLLYLLAVVVNARYSGFLFNTVNVAEFNMVEEMVKAGLPILLFCLGNWSLTSLMDGAGSMKDIFTATAYALFPVVVIYPLITLASGVLTVEEAAFYHFFETFAYVWVAFLIFAGNKAIHQYSVKKTIAMLLLTLVAIGVILFLVLLFVTFVEQMWSFGYSIYKELVFRV